MNMMCTRNKSGSLFTECCAKDESCNVACHWLMWRTRKSREQVFAFWRWIFIAWSSHIYAIDGDCESDWRGVTDDKVIDRLNYIIDWMWTLSSESSRWEKGTSREDIPLHFCLNKDRIDRNLLSITVPNQFLAIACWSSQVWIHRLRHVLSITISAQTVGRCCKHMTRGLTHGLDTQISFETRTRCQAT
jgi:hypothetical protein